VRKGDTGGRAAGSGQTAAGSELETTEAKRRDGARALAEGRRRSGYREKESRERNEKCKTDNRQFKMESPDRATR
jgi:hypothetical protein